MLRSPIQPVIIPAHFGISGRARTVVVSACAACTGYDPATGLGTLNAATLLTQLAGTAVNPPLLTPAGISGVSDAPLLFTGSVSYSNLNSNPLTYTLSGQPSGMTISSSAAVSWAAPVAGTCAVTVTTKDSKAGLSGSGLYTITFSNPIAPAVVAQNISGKVGIARSFNVAVTAQNAITYTFAS